MHPATVPRATSAWSARVRYGALVRPGRMRTVLRSAGGQGRSVSVQLLDYDPNILVAEPVTGQRADPRS